MELMQREVVKKYIKTYSNMSKKAAKTYTDSKNMNNGDQTLQREALKTKNAIEYLLEGTLKKNVCRYCLNVTSPLSELDQVLQVAYRGTLYKVTIRSMIASFHPFKVIDDPNFPNKICDKCLNRTISAYLFTQQCEQSERALRNCFDDIFEKIEKLDSLDGRKKRGRQKINPNYNVIYTEHKFVIDYAEPAISIVNIGAKLPENGVTTEINKLECLKCCQVFPNMESLLNHERTHPKTMWYNCRFCGKSFVKRYQLKRHIEHMHIRNKQSLLLSKDVNFRCFECGICSDNYNEHLQHIEKHKFKVVLENLIERNIDRLCAVCFNKDDQMCNLNKMVCLHGGYPEISGDRSLYQILGSTIPTMSFLHNYIGKNICKNCFDHAITSYVFINRVHCIRSRLNTCISHMLNNLYDIKQPESNIFLEISQNVVLPVSNQNYDEELLATDDEIDESKLSIDVLEEEFRIKSESEESEMEKEIGFSSIKTYYNTSKRVKNQSEKYVVSEFKKSYKESNDVDEIDNPAKQVTRTYMNRRLVNGYQSKLISNDKNTNHNIYEDVCSEFLTFKTKRKTYKRYYKYRFTCPLCNKYFISDYYLKRHILKHVNKKVICNICGLLFKSKFSLYEHKKMAHLLKKTDYCSCKTCGRTFFDEKSMKVHEKYHTELQCHLCNKTFTLQKHYNSHMHRHAAKFNVLKKDNIQTCSFCEKECSDDNYLSLHVNKVHLQIKPYSCDMCDKQFYTESNMNNHKKVHRKLCIEKCALCNRTLKSRKDLVIHIRKHIGVKPHMCQLCGMSFYSETRVGNHMKKYHGGRFCCKLCKSVFISKTALKDHVNTAHSIF